MLNAHQPNDELTARTKSRRRWIAGAAAALVILVIAIALARSGEEKETLASTETAEHHEEEANAVELSPEALRAAGIQIVEVVERDSTLPVKATGTIEADQHRIAQVSSLVSARVDRILVEVGHRVRQGEVLALLASPEVAELKGKLLEARARLNLAESTLRRLRKLDELGAAAGKDLAAAEAEAQTARAEVAHLESGLASLGATDSGISAVALRAPMSGTVVERLANPGVGVEAGKPLFTIADLSVVWVIANVPETQVHLLRPGSAAQVRSAGLGETIASGRVSYIDPLLNEATRTARVRLEVANPKLSLRVGQFVEVTFESIVSTTPSGKVPVIPEEAIQRLENRTVVFVPAGEPGHFKVRDVELGEQVDEYRTVKGGLTRGEKVVAKGSFVLKTQLLKGELGEHGH